MNESRPSQKMCCMNESCLCTHRVVISGNFCFVHVHIPIKNNEIWMSHVPLNFVIWMRHVPFQQKNKKMRYESRPFLKKCFMNESCLSAHRAVIRVAIFVLSTCAFQSKKVRYEWVTSLSIFFVWKMSDVPLQKKVISHPSQKCLIWMSHISTLTK